VELRDKLASTEMITASGPGQKNINKTTDAILALVSLGYKQNEAAKMVASSASGGENMSVEEIIRRALKR